MSFPEFTLSNLPQVLDSGYETEGATLGIGGGNATTNPAKSGAIRDARIEEWARAAGRCLEVEDFACCLDAAQIEGELADVFRDTPEFGRSLASRLVDFLDSNSTGPWTLIGGGGESVIFGDPENQRVIKLLSPAGRANFGWVINYENSSSKAILRPGSLAEALRRFWLAEQTFPTGLELEAIGRGGRFLLLSQPFILGTNPDFAAIASFMTAQGWERHEPETELSTLADLTWRKGSRLATDVRPENFLHAEADGLLYPFDLIVG